MTSRAHRHGRVVEVRLVNAGEYGVTIALSDDPTQTEDVITLDADEVGARRFRVGDPVEVVAFRRSERSGTQ